MHIILPVIAHFEKSRTHCVVDDVSFDGCSFRFGPFQKLPDALLRRLHQLRTF